MSMSLSGFTATSAASAATSIVPAPLGHPQTAADKAKAASDAAKAANQALLDEVKKKGLYAWAQEQKFEALKAKIRAQVLQQKGLTEEGLAGLSKDDRAAAESSIEEEVARLVKETMQTALEGKAKEDAQQGKPAQPMIIDVSV